MRIAPDFHEVLKLYDQLVHLRKSLILICWEIESNEVAKVIIDRIITGYGTKNDTLDEYLRRDGIRTESSKVKILQEYLNRKDELGVSPLHLASYKGNIIMVKLLCANGANPFLTTEEGMSVIHTAAEGDAVNVIYYFINHYGLDVNIADNKNWTPLHWSVVEGNEIAATYLISWGANINCVDCLGNTPLHLSIHRAEKELNTRLTRILLLKGADRNNRNSDDRIPIEEVSASEVEEELRK